MPPIIYDRSSIDKTVVQSISLNTLLSYPIWQGNRFLDEERVAELKRAVNSPNDLHYIYYAIKYTDDQGQTHIDIIDGQHRISVLKSMPIVFKDTHQVILILKTVENQEEAVDYFNKINNMKPQRCEDKKIVINSYIAALSKAFPRMLRSNTNRPYMSVEKLRDCLLAQNIATIELTPERFVSLAKQQNEIWLKKLQEKLDKFPDHSKKTTIIRCLDNKFALSFPEHFEWLKDVKLAI